MPKFGKISPGKNFWLYGTYEPHIIMIVCELCRKVELLGYRVVGRWKFNEIFVNSPN